jgi:hypothetical protein
LFNHTSGVLGTHVDEGFVVIPLLSLQGSRGKFEGHLVELESDFLTHDIGVLEVIVLLHYKHTKKIPYILVFVKIFLKKECIP